MDYVSCTAIVGWLAGDHDLTFFAESSIQILTSKNICKISTVVPSYAGSTSSRYLAVMGWREPLRSKGIQGPHLTCSDLSTMITTIFTGQRCLYFRVLSRHLGGDSSLSPLSLCWAWAEPSDFDLNQFATPPIPSVSAFMNCEFNHPIWCRINLARSRLSWVWLWLT